MEQPSNSSEDVEKVAASMPTTPSTTIFPPWFLLAVATVLLTMFAASYIVDMFSTKYEVPAGIYGIVIIIVGGIYGSETVKGLRK